MNGTDKVSFTLCIVDSLKKKPSQHGAWQTRLLYCLCTDNYAYFSYSEAHKPMILTSSLKWSSLFITTYTSFASRRGATKTEFHFGCILQLCALANWEHNSPTHQLVQIKSVTVGYLQNVDLFRKPQCIFWKNSTFFLYLYDWMWMSHFSTKCISGLRRNATSSSNTAAHE